MTDKTEGVSAHERRVMRLPAELREEAEKSVCHVSMCSASLLRDAADEIERLRDEWETRADGERVRKDRWEWTVRRIAALLVGNRKEFECDDVVEGVRLLLPRNESRDDAEALVHAAQNGFGPNAGDERAARSAV